jgi:hypothetical protein
MPRMIVLFFSDGVKHLVAPCPLDSPLWADEQGARRGGPGGMPLPVLLQSYVIC